MLKQIKKLLLGLLKINRSTFEILFKKSNFLSSLYYLLFNKHFSREHRAVLAGKEAFQKSLINIGRSSFLIRRNIHRLEKGLLMQPRKKVFAENYIENTVNVYERAIKLKNLNNDEKMWATDVLVKYFQVVDDTIIIKKSRKKFNEILENEITSPRCVPYLYKSITKSNVAYEDLKNLFKQRRAVRWYQDKIVPKNLIEKAINLASLAPSACNRQPYFFYVSDNKQKAISIAKCAGGTSGWAENIPCIAVIIGDLSAYQSERDRHVIYIDSSLAAMQLMLALETLGLSSCPINWPDIEKSEKKIEKILSLKKYERPIMLLSIGYAQDKGRIAFSQKKDAKTLIRNDL